MSLLISYPSRSRLEAHCGNGLMFPFKGPLHDCMVLREASWGMHGVHLTMTIHAIVSVAHKASSAMYGWCCSLFLKYNGWGTMWHGLVSVSAQMLSNIINVPHVG